MARSAARETCKLVGDLWLSVSRVCFAHSDAEVLEDASCRRFRIIADKSSNAKILRSEAVR